MRKQSKKKNALSALLDALTETAAELAPVHTAAGFDLDPDFRRLSIKLPPQSLVDRALNETDGDTRNELTLRAERLEREYTDFAAARRKWKGEVADPIRAKRGELGELADPAGKLRTLRRGICGDILFLTGLLKPKHTESLSYSDATSPKDNNRKYRYPHDEEALTILKEAARRITEADKYKDAVNYLVFYDIIEQRGIGRTPADKRKTLDRMLYGKLRKDGRRQLTKPLPTDKAAEDWGKRLSGYMLDKGISKKPRKGK